MKRSEESSGGFVRGFIYGVFIAAVGFVTYAVLNPLKSNITVAENDNTPLQAGEPILQETGQVGRQMSQVNAQSFQPEIPANIPIIDGPQLGIPATDGESGLEAGNDTAPTLGIPNTQFAIAVPEGSDSPTINTDVLEAPVVTDSLTTEVAVTRVESILTAGNALEDNAITVVGSDDLPYFSIVLEDAGDQELLRGTLAKWTAAISIGVSVEDPQAGDIAKGYGGVGFEIIALLPDDLGNVKTAVQVEAGLAAYFYAVPNATSVLSSQTSGFTTDPELAQALMAGLNKTGHGMLSFITEGAILPGLATDASVPNAQVFSVIDERPEPENVALALERAIAEAKQNGAVIVSGHANADTLTTLSAWLLGPGSSSVRIVPVSASIARLAE